MTNFELLQLNLTFALHVNHSPILRAVRTKRHKFGCNTKLILKRNLLHLCPHTTIKGRVIYYIFRGKGGDKKSKQKEKWGATRSHQRNLSTSIAVLDQNLSLNIKKNIHFGGKEGAANHFFQAT